MPPGRSFVRAAVFIRSMGRRQIEEHRKHGKRVRHSSYNQKLITDKGFVKIEIVLAQGKKEFDKREAIKEKDNRREMERTRLTVSKYNADK